MAALRVLWRAKRSAGTARPHSFRIFGSAFFRVALRIGTKLEGVISAQDVAAQAHYVAHVEDETLAFSSEAAMVGTSRPAL
jgi:hypothetical protein